MRAMPLSLASQGNALFEASIRTNTFTIPAHKEKKQKKIFLLKLVDMFRYTDRLARLSVIWVLE